MLITLFGDGYWTMRLDTYTVHTGQVSGTYTRGRAFFLGREDVKLLVRKRWHLDTLLENVGLRGMPSGNPEFARRYIVKAKPESRARSLITAELTAVLLAQPSLTLQVKAASRRHRKAMGPLARHATMLTTGVIKEPERLAGMFSVVAATLSALDRAGIAAREPVPGDD